MTYYKWKSPELFSQHKLFIEHCKAHLSMILLKLFTIRWSFANSFGQLYDDRLTFGGLVMHSLGTYDHQWFESPYHEVRVNKMYLCFQTANWRSSYYWSPSSTTLESSSWHRPSFHRRGRVQTRWFLRVWSLYKWFNSNLVSSKSRGRSILSTAVVQL